MINLELSVDNLEQCDDLEEALLNQTDICVVVGETLIHTTVVERHTVPIVDRQPGQIRRTFRLREITR